MLCTNTGTCFVLDLDGNILWFNVGVPVRAFCVASWPPLLPHPPPPHTAAAAPTTDHDGDRDLGPDPDFLAPLLDNNTEDELGAFADEESRSRSDDDEVELVLARAGVGNAGLFSVSGQDATVPSSLDNEGEESQDGGEPSPSPSP